MAPTKTTDDYYAILELSSSAKVNEITSSYRRLARLLHPDRNKKPDATKTFQILQSAYETLSDTIKRQVYDRDWPAINKAANAQKQYTQNAHKAHANSCHRTPESNKPANDSDRARLIRCLYDHYEQYFVQICAVKKQMMDLELELHRLAAQETEYKLQKRLKSERNSYLGVLLSAYEPSPEKATENIARERQKVERANLIMRKRRALQQHTDNVYDIVQRREDVKRSIKEEQRLLAAEINADLRREQERERKKQEASRKRPLEQATENLAVCRAEISKLRAEWNDKIRTYNMACNQYDTVQRDWKKDPTDEKARQDLVAYEAEVIRTRKDTSKAEAKHGIALRRVEEAIAAEDACRREQWEAAEKVRRNQEQREAACRAEKARKAQPAPKKRKREKSPVSRRLFQNDWGDSSDKER